VFGLYACVEKYTEYATDVQQEAQLPLSNRASDAFRCSPIIHKYTVSQKNDTDVTYYRFNPHQPISVIFGRDVAERVCY